jgi:hypothetical protein
MIYWENLDTTGEPVIRGESNPEGGEHFSRKLFEQRINSYLFGTSTYEPAAKLS